MKSIIDRAVALAPNSPESHLALGLLFYWGHRQYEMALAEFNRTLELQPNNVDPQMRPGRFPLNKCLATFGIGH